VVLVVVVKLVVVVVVVVFINGTICIIETSFLLGSWYLEVLLVVVFNRNRSHVPKSGPSGLQSSPRSSSTFSTRLCRPHKSTGILTTDRSVEEADADADADVEEADADVEEADADADAGLIAKLVTP